MIIDHPTAAQTDHLKRLWQAVFQDPGDYIEGFFVHAFSPDRCLLAWENGEAAAMVHWLDMTCRGKKVAYIYAVATARRFRGRGLCRALMDRAHSLLEQRGYAGAVLVPQEGGLFHMYKKMGYEVCGGIRRHFCGSGAGPIPLKAMTWQDWNARRDAMLPPGGVALSSNCAAYLGAMAEFWAGEDVLLACVREDGVLHGIELLGSAAAAPGILAALGCEEGNFLTPGESPFAMYRSLDGDSPAPTYFGIAFD